jgi:hypothetical protein
VVVIADKNGLVWINDLTGGLNDTDAPQDLAANQCQIAQNVEWVTTKFAQRRQGGTNGMHATEPWGSQASLVSLMRHTPTADEGAAELFGVDNQATPMLGRLAGGNQFVAVTVADAWTQADAKYINGVSLNGKFFTAGNAGSVDRLHVIESGTMRRVGLATPAAATVANTGGGTYAATLRYYKVQWFNSSVSPRPHSELSPAVSFTPSGAGTHARVTRPALPGESETHWHLWGSPDGVNYYLIAKTAVGTTTFDDNTAPANYATLGTTIFGTTTPAAGFPTDADYFTPPMSAKYLLADEDRLLLLGSWETASAASAVMWTPVNGTTPTEFLVADDERVPSTNRLDLDRQDGGGITGGGILSGTIYVFKLSHIYQLRRTGDADLPYQAIPVTKSLGALSHKSIVVGEDDLGRECLYFLSRRGPYRLTADGLEYLGRDIETLWGTVNQSATTPPFGVWHQDKRQVQWWLTTGASTTPDQKLVFHARYGRRTESGNVRGGWAIHTEGAALAFSACMFANTLGATMSLDLKPYVGQRWISLSDPDGPCIKYDADGAILDRGGLSGFVARVQTGAFPPGGLGMKGRVTQAYVIGTPVNRTIQIDIVEDFGARTRTGLAVLPAATASETRVVAKVDGDARATDVMYVAIEIDDTTAFPAVAEWAVDAVGLRVKPEGAI